MLGECRNRPSPIGWLSDCPRAEWTWERAGFTCWFNNDQFTVKMCYLNEWYPNSHAVGTVTLRASGAVALWSACAPSDHINNPCWQPADTCSCWRAPTSFCWKNMLCRIFFLLVSIANAEQEDTVDVVVVFLLEIWTSRGSSMSAGLGRAGEAPPPGHSASPLGERLVWVPPCLLRAEHLYTGGYE